MGTRSDDGSAVRKDPARQAGSTGHDFVADLKLREEEDELPLPVAEQPVACVGQPIEYDFSADLKLRDEVMDELLELAQAAPMIEQQPAVSAEHRAEEYDFTLDLRMIEGEEAEGGYITRSVMATEQELPAAMEEGAAADLEWEQVEAEFCQAEREHSCSHAPREEIGVGAAQNPDALSALGGLHHAERDDYITAAISKQLAAAAETTRLKRLAFSKFRSKSRPTGALSWLLSLEMWLVLASVSLVFQIFPAAFWSLLAIVDVRNWPWSALVAVEVAVIVVLLLLKVRQTADA
jgi:hypothetical protein